MSAPTAADLAEAENKLAKLRSEAATALENARAKAVEWKDTALAATGAVLIKAAEGQVARAEEYANEVEKIRKKVEAASAAASSGAAAGSGAAGSGAAGSGAGGTKGGRRGKRRAKKTVRRKRSTKHR